MYRLPSVVMLDQSLTIETLMQPASNTLRTEGGMTQSQASAPPQGLDESESEVRIASWNLGVPDLQSNMSTEKMPLTQAHYQTLVPKARDEQVWSMILVQYVSAH